MGSIDGGLDIDAGQDAAAFRVDRSGDRLAGWEPILGEGYRGIHECLVNNWSCAPNVLPLNRERRESRLAMMSRTRHTARRLERRYAVLAGMREANASTFPSGSLKKAIHSSPPTGPNVPPSSR